MRILKLLTCTSCLALAICSQAAAQATADQQTVKAAGAGGSATVAEVIVTASRRSENIREVPTAVSAYSGSKLRDNHIASLSDLAAITPNVQISTYLTNADINIRGIGNGNFVQAGGDPGVAVQSDGVYLGQAALALSTFLDVNRVEVLRGPQGTLFGRNATGGMVNIVPNEPTANPSYGFDVTAGVDPTMVHSTGYLSGPLNGSGTLLGRFSAEQDYNAGYTRSLAPGGPSRLDGINDGAVRGQLEWRPTDAFSARLLLEYARDSDPGPANYLLGTPNSGPVVFPFLSGGGITLPPGFPTGNPSSREAYANVGSKDLSETTVNLTTDWSVVGGHLKALLSYNTNSEGATQDSDGTQIAYTYSKFINNAHQVYEELTYASDGSKAFNYVVGQTFYSENFRQFITVPTMGQAPPPYTAGGTIDTTSYAFFAHAQYEFLPSTKLFAGVRYTHDDKSINEFLIFGPFGLNLSDSKQASWARTTYEVGLSHDFSRSVTGYVKYATGYKGGGFVVGSLGNAYQPETNTNIEVGLKGSYLDGALQANLAGFHMDYNNLQVNQIVGQTDVVTNAARATVDGVEVESVIHPTNHLRIEANGAWLNARFDQFMTGDSSRPQLGVLNLAGHDLPGAPHFNASIGAFYDMPVSTGTVTLGARFNWKSRIYFSEFNIPISSQSAVGKLDLSLNFKSQDQHWSAGLFALNATDVQVKGNVVVISSLLGSLALGTYQPGRQVGVSIGYHF